MSKSVLSTEQQIESLWKLGGLSTRELTRRVWGGMNQTDILSRANELAYSFLLAVFPLLLFLVALFGVLASQGSALRNALFDYAQPALPPAAYQILLRTFQEVTHNPAVGKIT